MKIITIILFVLSYLQLNSQQHPQLILTQEGRDLIRQTHPWPKLFKQTFDQSKTEVDAFIQLGINVPVPKDMAGGYSHEVHKKNFLLVPKVAFMYQLTGEEHYALFVKNIFWAYAELFPQFGKHPARKSYAPGKFFWQCLNDSNWLVYMSQAYDCIYDYLTKEERRFLESHLFRPYADYISLENPQFYNRIHNHSTWGNAAVGMIALVMNDEELLHRALYGLDTETIDNALDNDGGLIRSPGQEGAGFFAQLDHSFSPDGYYTEGPYYQRYAMAPFILFVQALDNCRPDLKIFDYREGLLNKALISLLNLTDQEGNFYPINDAQKKMSYKSRALISAVSAVYGYYGQDPQLLSIAESQGETTLDQNGLLIASEIEAGNKKPFKKSIRSLKDGAKGDRGGVSILRCSDKNKTELSCLFKYAAQGMGHGHFDRLSYSIYHGASEVLQDYGAARWVNIDQKSGGRYLEENRTWAKQSIAHNTVVINEESHFEGHTQTGELYSSMLYYQNAENPDTQIASAKDLNAYPGTELHRSIIMLDDPLLTEPLLIDIYRVQSDSTRQLDLPFHFKTQLMETSFELNTALTQLNILGKANGYQHVWKESLTRLDSNQYDISWFTDDKFFSASCYAEKGDEIIMARTGANDPNFNLRRDAFWIHRKPEAQDALFVSLISAHGIYSPVTEIPINPYPLKKQIEIIRNKRDYSIIDITIDQNTWRIKLCNNDNDKNKNHIVNNGTDSIEWTGPIQIDKL